MPALTGLIGVSFTLNYENSVDFRKVVDPLTKAYSLSLTDGAGVNQAQKLWADQRTVASGANDDLDLAGVLTDAFGATLTLTKVKGIWIYSDAANTTVLSLGGGTNPFIDWLIATGNGIKIRPGGHFLLTAPDATAYVVTATTADILRVANAAGAAALYDIVIIGV